MSHPVQVSDEVFSTLTEIARDSDCTVTDVVERAIIRERVMTPRKESGVDSGQTLAELLRKHLKPAPRLPGMEDADPGDFSMTQEQTDRIMGRCIDDAH
ncbi:MAG: hypothetical protein K1X57_05965 [Gemmataceae bacterium]|nr:hypothetical protein [Gemmataceae bacterium]